LREDDQFRRLSVSAVKWLYCKRFNTTKECLEYVGKLNFTNIATSPHQKGKINFGLMDSKAMYTQHHLAVWFGNETHGLTDEAINAADFCISIQMKGIIESMNLASS